MEPLHGAYQNLSEGQLDVALGLSDPRDEGTTIFEASTWRRRQDATSDVNAAVTFSVTASHHVDVYFMLPSPPLSCYYRLCTSHFHDTEHLSTPAFYLILPESVWEGYSHLVQRGFFSLGCTHLQTSACLTTFFLGGCWRQKEFESHEMEKVKIWFPNETHRMSVDSRRTDGCTDGVW
jgi:hypothetical protein